MGKSLRETLLILLFLFFVLGVWLSFETIAQPDTVVLEKRDGLLDLSGRDLSETVYFYTDNWENYAERLYTPEDFASGTVDAPEWMLHEDYERYQFATHRMQMRLPAGGIYALSMKSTDYAMRLYINGQEAGSVGHPADNPQDNVPRVAERTFYFSPQTDITTLVVQSSNWVHKEGAYSPNFYVGTAENIENRNQHDRMMTFLITGSLLTSCLYHLGLFLLNRSRKVVLVFALCCLLLVLVMNKLPPLFFPGYNWFVVFRMEYIVHFLTFAMLTWFLELLFPRRFHRGILRFYYALAGLGVLLSLWLPTVTLSTLLILFDGLSIGMIVYILVCLALATREKKAPNLLAFIGFFLICLFGVNDILYSNGYEWLGNIAGQIFTTPIAMMFFVFCFALVLSLEYAQTKHNMLLAQRQVLEAEARYVAVLSGISHPPAHASPADFGLSQRERDVLWLLLDGKTRTEIAATLYLGLGTVNTYCSRIYKKTGASGFQDLIHIFGLQKTAKDSPLQDPGPDNGTHNPAPAQKPQEDEE